jgi:hypothetical protein
MMHSYKDTKIKQNHSTIKKPKCFRILSSLLQHSGNPSLFPFLWASMTRMSLQSENSDGEVTARVYR